jgi:hypothetical protein
MQQSYLNPVALLGVQCYLNPVTLFGVQCYLNPVTLFGVQGFLVAGERFFRRTHWHCKRLKVQVRGKSEMLCW